MDPFLGGDLAISVTEIDAPPTFVLVWKGRSNERDPRATLGAFLHGVVAHAAQRGAIVELHCQRVLHINSATIGCLVELSRASAAAAVRVVLRYDGSIAWQRFTFEALAVLAKGDGGFVLEPT